jgi:RHS repeat-associated protein
MRFEYADDRMPVAVTTEGVTYYLAYDQVGSLRIVADSAGDVVKRIDYDSFGNIIEDTAPAFKIPFGFAGGSHDRDTGLVRFGFRDYDPDVGRWTAKDPIGFAGGDTDLYGYVLNDPVNTVDPIGLLSILIGGGGSAVAPTGLEGSAGVVINPGLGENKADIGVFGSIGGGAGINVSADVFVGFVKGGIENVSGTTINANAVIGPISFVFIFNIDTGEFMGLTVGLGPSVTPIAGSITGSFTGTYTLRDLLEDLRDQTYASNPCK